MFRVAPLLTTTCGLLAAGCASVGRSTGFPADATARAATDAPSRFTVPAGTDAAGGVCLSPLTDPRSGARLPFVRAGAGRGDYEVAVGQYGARAGELLRIDCRTWQAIGLVRR